MAGPQAKASCRGPDTSIDVFLLGHLGLTLLVARLVAPFTGTGERFPLGFLLVGALLPDLIDKPLGHALLGWDNGRLWAHTLLFASLIVALALARASRRLGALGLGTVCHQLLDQAWQDPTSWLWPMAGPFPREVSAGVHDWIAAILSEPFLWATEVAGLFSLVALLLVPWLGSSPRWWRPTAPGDPAALGPEAEAGIASEPETGP